jgi:serine/threonine protein kinase
MNFLCFSFRAMVRSNRITLTNFGLSKHLVRDSEMLTDQRGSLAYVSPDVLSGEFVHLFGCLLIEAKLGSLTTERDSNFKGALCCQFMLVNSHFLNMAKLNSCVSSMVLILLLCFIGNGLKISPVV